MKKSHFFWWLVIFMWFLVFFDGIFGDFLVGTRNPRHIATKSQQIKFWSISKKSWDWVSAPPPSLGQIPNFYRKFVLQASLIALTSEMLLSYIFWPACNSLLSWTSRWTVEFNLASSLRMSSLLAISACTWWYWSSWCSTTLTRWMKATPSFHCGRAVPSKLRTALIEPPC